MEEVNVGGQKRRKWHVCCAVLRYISYAKFLQILEVLRDFHRLFGSRNSPTTGILHTVRHVYRSVWPAREAKPRFGTTLERSAHDYETRLFKPHKIRTVFQPSSLKLENSKLVHIEKENVILVHIEKKSWYVFLLRVLVPIMWLCINCIVTFIDKHTLGWSEWSSFTPCNSRCTKYRQRVCFSLQKAHCPGMDSHGVLRERVKCSEVECESKFCQVC